MALNFPSSPAQDQVYVDDNNINWQFDGVKWNVIKSTAYKTYNGITAGITSAFAATATATAISWDNITINVGDYYEEGYPSRIIIRSTAFYRINFSTVTGSQGSAYTITIKRNNTVTLSTTTITRNQFINYDEILELSTGDYIEVFVSETEAAGTFLSGSTKIEVTRVGLSTGTAAEVFSGARVKVDSTYSTTASPAGISWDSTDFNQNSNSAGDIYWDNLDPTKLTIGTNGYFRIKMVMLTSVYDTYVITLKKNNTTTLTTSNVGSNNIVQLDEIYQFAVNDYVELIVNDSSGTGGLLVGTYLEIIRIGNTLG